MVQTTVKYLMHELEKKFRVQITEDFVIAAVHTIASSDEFTAGENYFANNVIDCPSISWHLPDGKRVLRNALIKYYYLYVDRTPIAIRELSEFGVAYGLKRYSATVLKRAGIRTYHEAFKAINEKGSLQRIVGVGPKTERDFMQHVYDLITNDNFVGGKLTVGDANLYTSPELDSLMRSLGLAKPTEKNPLLTAKDVIKWWSSLKLETVQDYNNALYNFRIVFACNSANIEESDISYHNAREIFEDDRVTNFTGDVKDIVEMYNQKLAYGFIIKHLINKTPITREFILKLHRTLLRGCYDEDRWAKGERPGKFKKGDYCVGRNEVGVYPEEVEEHIADLVQTLEEVQGKRDALSTAVIMHLIFEDIHPFADGNGRVGRTLMNYYLMLNGYPPIIIFEEDKNMYYRHLETFSETEEYDDMLTFAEYQLIKTWEKHITF